MIERKLTGKLLELSRQYRVVTVIGPRQAGKSTLCRHVFPDKPLVNLEDPEVRSLALSDPKGLLARYPDGCFIDEIQRVPELLSYIQVEVDREGSEPGRYILSGSHQLLLMESVSQSLAGRTAIVKLLPLSQSELRELNQDLSLDEVLVRGSYPELVSKNLSPAESYNFYVQTYLERDVREIQAVKDLLAFQHFIKLLAGRSGALLNMASIASDLGVSEGTVKNWLSVAEASFLAFRLMPYYKKLGKRIRKTPKLYFYDTGLLCYLLGIRNAEQLAVHPLRGAIVETYVVSECLKALWNNVRESNLYFYLDRVLEIDLVIETVRGPQLVEIKSAATFREELLRRIVQAGDRLEGIREDSYLVMNTPEPFRFKNTTIVPVKDLTALAEAVLS